MMLLTTAFIAALIVAPIYVLWVRRIKSALAGYAAMLAAGGLCFAIGSVHFAYIAIEVAALGCLTVWLHHRLRKATARQSKQVMRRPDVSDNVRPNKRGRTDVAQLKRERVQKRIYNAHQQAADDIGGYLESNHNRTRRHQNLACVSPDQFTAATQL